MAELNAEPEETELDSDSDHKEEHIVELSKLDQSQATLLRSIIQCKEDDIVKTIICVLLNLAQGPLLGLLMLRSSFYVRSVYHA